MMHVMTDQSQAEHVFVKDNDNPAARRTICCVVGGGTGGGRPALLLARRGVAVTLLELTTTSTATSAATRSTLRCLEIIDELGPRRRVCSNSRTRSSAA